MRAWPLPLILLLSTAALADEPDGRTIYRHLLRATTAVTSTGNRGTGWLIDRDARLLVTSFHVVGDDDSVDVLFPATQDGKLIAERTWYRDHREQLRKSGLLVAGKVVARDADRDLALIELKSVPESAVALTLAVESAEPGDRVHSIGNRGDLETLWTYTSGVVRQRYRSADGYRWQGKQLGKGSQMIVTQSPIHEGDSGGPMVNDAGEVIAVAAAVRWQGPLASVGIDGSEVRALLKKARPDVKLRSGMKPTRSRDHGLAEELMRATGLVRTATSSKRATAWMFSVPRRLAVSTCHAVGPRDTVRVEFRGKNEVGACVLTRDERRNLALLELDTIPDGVTELKLAEDAAEPGQRVHTVGHPNGAESAWLYSRGTVRQVARTRLIREAQEDGREPLALLLELPPAEDDSGSAVVDDRGQVVGCLSDRESPQQLVRYGAEVSEIRAFLEAAKPWHEPRTATEIRARATLYTRSRRLNRAIADLDVALRLEPQNAAIYHERARVRWMMGDGVKAQEDCGEALRLDDRLSAAHALRAEILLQKREPAAALEASATAVRLAPKCAAGFAVRGRVQRHLGDLDAALADGDEAVQLDPNSAMAYFERGRTRRARQEHEQAAADFTRAIEFDPLWADAYRQRAEVHRLLDQLKAAAADLAQAREVELQTRNP